MANIWQALQRTKTATPVDFASIAEAKTGKAETPGAAPGKLDLGAAIEEEKGAKQLSVLSEQAQLQDFADAQQLAGVKADAAEKKADLVMQQKKVDQDLDMRTNTLLKQYSQNWSALDEKRRENMMSTIMTVNNIRNNEQMLKIEQEAKMRGLEDEIKFKTAQATAQYSEFLDLARKDARVRNYIYANGLRAQEELARINGADAFSMAIDALRTERVQRSWQTASIAGSKLASNVTYDKDSGWGYQTTKYKTSEEP